MKQIELQKRQSLADLPTSFEDLTRVTKTKYTINDEAENLIKALYNEPGVKALLDGKTCVSGSFRIDGVLLAQRVQALAIGIDKNSQIATALLDDVVKAVNVAKRRFEELNISQRLAALNSHNGQTP